MKIARYNNLQVLRAISIIFVVGFHLRLPGFSAGYLGVDVFLVISGFLMAKIFETSVTSSLLNRALKFYIKRIKRLVPAYLITSLFSSLVFYIITLPHERIRILEQNLSNFLFLTNITNWLENQYFSTSLLRPTLSFWSLALEIQFYLVFPFLFIWVSKKKTLISAIICISAGIFFILNIISPATSFYLLPARLWEFSIGILIASIHEIKFFNFLRKEWMFAILSSSLIILISLLQFIASENSGLRNLLVTILSAGVLISSLKLGSVNYVQKNLARIGDYSYSIYLVHLPIITAMGYHAFEGNNVPSTFITLVFTLILIAFFSYLSFNYVENFFRIKIDLKKLTVFYLCFLLISGMFYLNRQVIAKTGFSAELINISYNAIDRAPFRCGTFTRVEVLHKVFKTPDSCLLNKYTIGKHYLLIGNSHADSIKHSLANYLELKNISFYMLRDNLALSMNNIRIAESEILNRKISKVIIHSSPGTTDPKAFKELGDFLASHKIGLEVIGPVPTYSYLIPKALFDSVKDDKRFETKNLQTYISENESELEFYKQASIEGWVKYIEIGSVFCSPDCVVADNDFRPFYIDSSHLTLTGSDYLISRIGHLI